MATIYNVAFGELDSSTPLSDRHASQERHATDLRPDSRGWRDKDIRNFLKTWSEGASVQGGAGFTWDEEIQNLGKSFIFGHIGSFMGYLLWPDRRLVLASYSGLLPPHRMSLDEINQIDIDNVCEILRVWGQHDLAERIAYFASDEDLEDGDIPLTLESARGFLSFFGAVKSEGRVSLTCSSEGWLCAVWRFPDERRASIWFLDTDRVMFAATNTDGDFIEIDGGGDVANSWVVMTKLIQAGLLIWDSDTSNSGSFHPSTMLPGIVGSVILQKMGSQQRERFSFERTRENVTFLPTGSNTSRSQTDAPRLTTLFGL